MIKKIYTHFKTITKHKLLVGKYCFKLGMYKQCIMHDMSKYLPTEFIECIKYANGVRSPISISREINGYSKAWLHHKGRNKHHFEYWIDTNGKPVLMPYRYSMEYLIDVMCANIVYTENDNKTWNESMLLKSWLDGKPQANLKNMHKFNFEFITKSFEFISIVGAHEAFKDKKYFENLYNNIIGE